MTENKRFELHINGNGQADIIDWVESNEKNAICIYNDLGVLPYSSAKALCELLNQLYDENEQLKDAINQRTDQCDKYYKENEQLKQQINELQFNKAKGQQEYQRRLSE